MLEQIRGIAHDGEDEMDSQGSQAGAHDITTEMASAHADPSVVPREASAPNGNRTHPPAESMELDNGSTSYPVEPFPDREPVPSTPFPSGSNPEPSRQMPVPSWYELATDPPVEAAPAEPAPTVEAAPAQPTGQAAEIQALTGAVEALVETVQGIIRRQHEVETRVAEMAPGPAESLEELGLTEDPAMAYQTPLPDPVDADPAVDVGPAVDGAESAAPEEDPVSSPVEEPPAAAATDPMDHAEHAEAASEPDLQTDQPIELAEVAPVEDVAAGAAPKPDPLPGPPAEAAEFAVGTEPVPQAADFPVDPQSAPDASAYVPQEGDLTEQAPAEEPGPTPAQRLEALRHGLLEVVSAFQREIERIEVAANAQPASAGTGSRTVLLDVGPLADRVALARFQQQLSEVPGVESVTLTGFLGGYASLEVTVDAVAQLGQHLRQNLDVTVSFEFGDDDEGLALTLPEHG
ncbi:MAG: hypothetical protein ACR2NA_10745 [Solirubrobacterales bacterium]